MVARQKLPAFLLSALLCLAVAAPAVAQDSGPRPDGPPPMEHSFHEGHGRWWDNPHMSKDIGLTDAQKKQMDAIFARYRQQLSDLKAKLDKDESAMRPMIEADHPDKGKILKQIDTIAQARANLEKTNARMLLGIRGVMTMDQWKTLRNIVQKHRHDWGPRPCGAPKGPPPPGTER